ncbi:translation initiation factor eIF-2B [Candidatus Bathyarchaeota archaeon]|nr:translation initiation factor eIF-2B [Candidatus Bathyarchaeota archaeon]
MSGIYDAEKLIQSIAMDRYHGAEWLSNAALGTMIAIALNASADDADELRETLKSYARRIAESRPSMTPITNKLGMFYSRLPEGAALNELRAAATKSASMIIKESRKDRSRLVENAKSVLGEPETVFTISDSSTVADVVLGVGAKNVVVTESRPQMEGRNLAERLAGEGVNVLLVVDAAAAMFMESADVAVVGADSVLYDGGFVNKVGTRTVALAARDQGVPFYVVCSTSKFNVMNYLGRGVELEEKDPSEVAELEGVNVRNPYFEVVPGRLVTGMITEMGVMEPLDIRRRMEEMRKQVEPLYRQP